MERTERMTTAELDRRLTAIENQLATIVAAVTVGVDERKVIYQRGYNAGRMATLTGATSQRGPQRSTITRTVAA